MAIRNIQDNDIEESIRLIDSFIFKNDKTGLLGYILYTQYLNNELKFIGCFKENEIIGILGYSKNYLTFLFIKKEYQKHNIGHMLFDEYLKQIKEETIYVDASKNNYKFYKKIGFIKNDEVIKQKKFQMKYNIGDVDGRNQKSYFKRYR